MEAIMADVLSAKVVMLQAAIANAMRIWCFP
jgi:hypothetical protein